MKVERLTHDVIWGVISVADINCARFGCGCTHRKDFVFFSPSMAQPVANLLILLKRQSLVDREREEPEISFLVFF